MKKLFTLVVVITLAAYGFGWFKLSESGVTRYLEAVERLAAEGRGDELCDLAHDDMIVSITDRNLRQKMFITGAKTQYCDYVVKSAKAVGVLNVTSEATRSNLKVERSWRHPWTVQVAYDEKRTTTMARLNVTVNTLSHDEMTLVNTMGGVKLMRLVSESPPMTPDERARADGLL